MLDGLSWLSQQGFNIDVAGRRLWRDDEQVLREGYAALFKRHNIQLDAFDQKALVLFPEITAGPNLPEITEDSQCGSRRHDVCFVAHGGSTQR